MHFNAFLIITAADFDFSTHRDVTCRDVSRRVFTPDWTLKIGRRTEIADFSWGYLYPKPQGS